MRLPSLQARQQRAARMAPDVLAGRCAAALISPIPRPSPWICAWRLAVLDLVVALGLQSHELLVLHGYETVDLVLAFDSLFELRSCRIDRHSWCVRSCWERVRTCLTTETAPSPTKRSLRGNASSGRPPPPHTCSPQAGQCSEAWTPSVAVLLACQRDQAAKRSNSSGESPRAPFCADTVARRGGC